MSSVVRAPQQRISKSLVALGAIGANNGGIVHRPAHFFDGLDSAGAVAVSATLYTVANTADLESLLSNIGGGEGPTTNYFVAKGNVVTDMGKTITVQVVSNASVSAEFQLVSVDTSESNTNPPGVGYINTRISRGSPMSVTTGLTYFARI